MRTKQEAAKRATTEKQKLKQRQADTETTGQGEGEFSARTAVRALVAWYDGAKREMPWRESRDPYAIWLSETMLQQTQVTTVIPYYHRFLERFPTVAALAAAPLSDVLALWAGLGYYRRAKHLHQAAGEMVRHHGSNLPASLELLLTLPGIGRYTAGAVGSIAFGLPVPVVDGNVMRVLARLFGYAADIALPKHHAFFWEKAGAMVAAAPRVAGCGKSAFRYGDVNQAMMELGATVCTPTSPKCDTCPLRDLCVAQREGRQSELPVKRAKKAVPVVHRKALVILREHKGREGREEVLLMERPAGGLWEHMWEFPTEPVATARVKEAQPKTATFAGLKLQNVRTCGEVRHQLTHRSMVYEVVTAQLADGRPPKSGTPNLPRCDEGHSYSAARWVGWPLARTDGLAMAKVVEKIAQAAAGNLPKTGNG